MKREISKQSSVDTDLEVDNLNHELISQASKKEKGRTGGKWAGLFLPGMRREGRWYKTVGRVARRVFYWRNLYTRANQILIDLLIMALSFMLAFLIRFEWDIPEPQRQRLFLLLPYVVGGRLVMNYFMGVYSLIWRYVSIRDIQVMLKPVGACSLMFFLLRFSLPSGYSQYRMPLSIIAIEFLLILTGSLGVRVLRRILYERFRVSAGAVPQGREKSVLLVGAGFGGVMVVREVERNRDIGLKIKGFVDDDLTKVNTQIAGVKVLGTTADLESLIRRLNIDEVIITIASAPRKDIRRIMKICKAVPIKVRIMPGLFEILGGQVRVSKFREVRIEDLLGRDVVNFDTTMPDVRERFSGKRILITGAGGSIGSELCRQVLRFDPSEVILVEKDENSLFEIDLKLKTIACCTVTPLIADICQHHRVSDIFEKFRPQVVFHAAAHKHVPLMELNPSEAILNNVIATNHLVELADQFGVESFVMLSTDKAVNPASIMGASKRLAEMIVQTRAAGSRTRFSCVRFGNVLASRGSVVPIFQKQIAEGGPITVTHPEVTRYFMTIPEAAHLVTQAGSIGRRGEIFVLDMGEPVKIIDLAKDLIHLSGLKLGEDIDIEFIGLRLGEKLHEELLIAKEGVTATKFHKIFIESPLKINVEDLNQMIRDLERVAQQGDQGGVCTVLDSWFNGSLKRSGSPERFLGAGRGGELPAYRVVRHDN